MPERPLLHCVLFVVALFAIRILSAATARESQAWFGLGFTCHVGGDRAPCESLVVVAVSPKGPADRAGIMAHDVITRINGKPARFATHGEALERFRKCRVGERLRFDIVRDGRVFQIVVPGERLPAEFAARWATNEELARKKDAGTAKSDRKP